jgi:hypothetical protein
MKVEKPINAIFNLNHQLHFSTQALLENHAMFPLGWIILHATRIASIEFNLLWKIPSFALTHYQ